MFSDDIRHLAKQVIDAATTRGLTISTAESCTGGLVSAALTEVPGSSAVLDRGYVTYSNAAKTEMLGVHPDELMRHGAVSAAVARAMAEGAATKTDVSVSITGVAGPGGGTNSKPVGLVHFAALGPRGMIHVEHRFGDIGRDEVRMASVRVALTLLLDRVQA